MSCERAIQSYRGRQRSNGRLDITVFTTIHEQYQIAAIQVSAIATVHNLLYRKFIGSVSLSGLPLISGGVPDWPRSHNTKGIPTLKPPNATSRLPVARDARARATFSSNIAVAVCSPRNLS